MATSELKRCVPFSIYTLHGILLIATLLCCPPAPAPEPGHACMHQGKITSKKAAGLLHPGRGDSFHATQIPDSRRSREEETRTEKEKEHDRKVACLLARRTRILGVPKGQSCPNRYYKPNSRSGLLDRWCKGLSLALFLHCTLHAACCMLHMTGHGIRR